MNFIDTHQHVIYRDDFGYAWTKDIPELSAGNFTFEDYDALTDGAGVVGTIFMETGVDDADHQAEARFVGQRVGTNNLLGQIASCRPEEEAGFDDWLEEGRNLGVVGYRRILHVVSDEVSQSETFRKNLRKIGRDGLPFDMCFLARQLPIAQALARACDDQILVLDHCGVPDIAASAFESWAEGISKIAEMDHVVVKLSGITAYCAPRDYGVDVLRPWVDHILGAFGPSRIVWGSDWPVVNTGSGLPVWIETTRQLLAHLSPDETSAITEKNALRVYGLE
ncbi:amidohydrolase family protein [Ruegeria arenilitoris]|uniref:amidohydrolase family protein n=1 Tax=Ruegeria arenilitoris TaxID=1173585 RepID=UPI00147CA2A6|nr:amidohydrolase family protein [Ruegeria arenilitoris]